MGDYKSNFISHLQSESIYGLSPDTLTPAVLYNLISINDNFYKIIERAFSFDIQSCGYIDVLRGDGCYSYKLLSILWNEKESNDFKSSILRPFITQLLRTPSEDYDIETQDTIIRTRNTDKLIKLVSGLLNDIYITNFLSSEIISIFKNINIQLCIKTTDTYPKLIGGLLILRLINPMIFLPWKYLGLDRALFTPSISNALVSISKIIQLISNESLGQNYSDYMNHWIKKQQVAWGIFFRKKFEMYDINDKENLVVDTINYKHREVISFLFELDNTKDYETITNLGANCVHHYKTIESAPNKMAMLSKTEFSVDAPIKAVYNWTIENTDNDKKILLENRTIRVINDNLSIKYLKYNMFLPLISNRDILFLEYKEFFKNEGFGIICRISIEMDDMPHQHELVRGEVKGGFIFRQDSGKTMVTHIIYTDPGGKFNYVPDRIKQYLCLRESKRLKKMSKAFKK